MLGLMQKHSLLISDLIEFAQVNHADTEIVSRRVEKDIHRTTWAQVAQRSKQIAHALDAAAVGTGERVATLAWNGYRHLELYFGVSGSGRVLHTLNPRLHVDQMTWIINHAEDHVLCFDMSFAPIVAQIRSRCPTVKHWIALCDAHTLAQAPEVSQCVPYESWIAPHSEEYIWPDLDENTASSLCYTSGTTGHPKGALYSHRSTVLHAFGIALPDVMNFSARDSVLPVVPMFHVNAWGIPYAAAMVGVKLVLPGPALDGESVYELIEQEKVTFAAGVPTVWQMLLNHVTPKGLRFQHLKRTVIGGSACPPSMISAFKNNFGVEVLHAWGMTELSPLGSLCTLKNKHLNWKEDEQMALLVKQGRTIFGVEMKIVGDQGQTQPHDGKTFGDLYVKGPWVIERYFKDTHTALKDGWFATGDVATIDAEGFMLITDRSKDVIKSGGEWISSIELENIAVAHPGVAMAACIGMPHPKWDERPVVVVVKRPESDLSKEALLNFYKDKVAKWQIPDDVIFVDSIPLGATGKMLKTRIREMLVDYRLPD